MSRSAGHRTPCPRPAGRAGALAAAALLLANASATAGLHLHCQFETAGESQTRDFMPVRDPYAVAPIDVSREFRFKAVLYGDEHHIEYVKLFAYYQGERQPMLLQMARYLAPRAAQGSDPVALTGRQTLYSPNLERPLEYGCAVRDDR